MISIRSLKKKKKERTKRVKRETEQNQFDPETVWLRNRWTQRGWASEHRGNINIIKHWNYIGTLNVGRQGALINPIKRNLICLYARSYRVSTSRYTVRRFANERTSRRSTRSSDLITNISNSCYERVGKGWYLPDRGGGRQYLILRPTDFHGRSRILPGGRLIRPFSW